MRDLIKKILRENSKLNTMLLKLINSKGLFYAMHVTGIKYDRVIEMVGDEFVGRKIKQEFIQDYFKNLGYGVGLPEIDVDPIFYSQNENEYREIFYLGASKVSIIVWDKESWDTEGEYGVLYYNLSDDMIDEIFEITMKLYNNEIEF